MELGPIGAVRHRRRRRVADRAARSDGDLRDGSDLVALIGEEMSSAPPTMRDPDTRSAARRVQCWRPLVDSSSCSASAGFEAVEATLNQVEAT